MNQKKTKNLRRSANLNPYTDHDEININLRAGFNYWLSKKNIFIIINLILITVMIFLFAILTLNQKKADLRYSEIVFKTTTTNSNIKIDNIISSEAVKDFISKYKFTNLNAETLTESLSLTKIDPNRENLRKQLLNLSTQDLKNLSISDMALNNLIKNLQNPENIYSLRLIHNSTNITQFQADLMTNYLIERFNNEIMTSLKLSASNLQKVEFLDKDDFENKLLLLDKYFFLKDLFSELKNNYSQYLINFDYSVYNNRINNLIPLFTIANLKQSNNKLNSLEFTITNKVKVIDKKIETLYQILDIVRINPMNSFENNSLGTSNVETNKIFSLDNDSIKSLLNIGSSLSSIELVEELVQEIKALSFKKADLIADLYYFDNEINLLTNNQNYGLSYVNELILDINKQVTLINAYLNPNNYIEIINPIHFYSEIEQIYKINILYFLLSVVLIFLLTFSFYIFMGIFINKN